MELQQRIEVLEKTVYALSKRLDAIEGIEAPVEQSNVFTLPQERPSIIAISLDDRSWDMKNLKHITNRWMNYMSMVAKERGMDQFLPYVQLEGKDRISNPRIRVMVLLSMDADPIALSRSTLYQTWKAEKRTIPFFIVVIHRSTATITREMRWLSPYHFIEEYHDGQMDINPRGVFSPTATQNDNTMKKMVFELKSIFFPSY